MGRQRRRTGGTSTPATLALARAGYCFTLHPYPHDPRHTSYGEEAATTLGVDGRRVLKTLVVGAGGADGRTSLAVAVLPVADLLDLKAMAGVLGAKHTELADPEQAARASGSVLGGISPIGMRRSLPTVVDVSAADHRTVFVSAGRRGLQVELAPGDLLDVVGGVLAPISRR